MRSSRWLLGVLVLLTVLPGAAPADDQQQPAPAEKHIVFVIGEREYQTRYTLPTFAEQHLVPRGFRYTVVHADADDRNVFLGLEAVRGADLLVLSVRRRTLPSEQFALLRDYIDGGKPLVALRTASHAFHQRRESPPPGHAEWRTFDTDVLGAHYDGHFGNDLLPAITVPPEAGGHPLLTGVEGSFVSGGSLYRSRDLAPTTRVLFEGRITENGETQTEPVAWTNERGRQRIVYTSLGHPGDFEQAAFRRLLVNAVYWALGDDPAAPNRFGDFFQADFPFITTTVDAGGRGPTAPNKNLTVLDEIGDAASSMAEGRRARVVHASDRDLVTAAAVVDAPDGVGLQVLEDRYLTLTIPAGTPASVFRVMIWKGETDRQDRFEQMLAAPVEMAEGTEGSAARWPGTVTVQGRVAPDTAAYVVDEIPLPLPNPWRRNVRVAGVDFFADGRAALVTFDGDVWLVSGLKDTLQQVRWKRFASGLYESMSLQIVEGQIYVFGRDQITRFHDLNNDGEADFYENFSNLAVQTVESREFPLAMVKKPGGGFYLGKGAAADAGPKTSPKIMQGFRAGGVHSGTVLEVSPDGRRVRVFASGFRQPYLGVHPETGLVTASDQQGNFVPSTPVYAVRDGGFYGVPATAHQPKSFEIPPPLTWIPHRIDQSGADQVWAVSERMGPLNGALLHLSYGEPAAFRVFIDDHTAEPMQGGLMRLPATFKMPLLKGAVHPGDGQVYVAGFQVWGSKAEQISGFARLRYTGLPSLLPTGMQTGTQGLLLRFDKPLDAEAATDAANYQAKRWNYRRTPAYGSGHFKLDDTPGEDAVAVTSTHLAPDGKTVLLVIPGMQQVMQMSLAYDLRNRDGDALQNSLYFTVNTLQPLDLHAEGFGDLDLDLETVPPPSTSSPVAVASVERGEHLYTRQSCIACHSIDGSLDGKLGPTFKGLYGAVRTLEDGTEVVADEAYLRESLLDPAAKIAEGYEVAMASYQGVLNEADVTSLILFIKSLSE